MPTNVEIKARVHDMPALESIAQSLADTGPEILTQRDVFFAVPNGRLKLRFLGERHGELILYERANAAGPRPSHYLIAPSTEPETLETILSTVLGVVGVVRKERRLYLIGQTRIHLDRVEGLGDYVELEVVLHPGQTEEAGRAIAEDLAKRLAIAPADLVEKAYIDLLLEAT